MSQEQSPDVHGHDSPEASEPMSEPGVSRFTWRTVDIVVAAVLAVAFGVVFWAWGNLWNTTSGAFTAFPPAQAFMYGIWLVPGVLDDARRPQAWRSRLRHAPRARPSVRCSAPRGVPR